MGNINVAIVGSRNVTDQEHVHTALDKAQRQLGFEMDDVSTIITGDAKGVDHIAVQIANENDIQTTVHEANWEEFGRSAGPQRNRLIVEDADIVIAIQKDNSDGTQNTIDIANKTSDVEVFVYKIGESLLSFS